MSGGVAIIGAGVTLHEALSAAKELANEGVSARVIDAYSVKPLDAATISEAVRATGGRLVVAEDHWAEGGLGEAVLSALADNGASDVAYRHLAVRYMPGSGSGAELMSEAGIDAEHIKRAAHEVAG